MLADGVPDQEEGGTDDELSDGCVEALREAGFNRL